MSYTKRIVLNSIINSTSNDRSNSIDNRETFAIAGYISTIIGSGPNNIEMSCVIAASSMELGSMGIVYDGEITLCATVKGVSDCVGPSFASFARSRNCQFASDGSVTRLIKIGAFGVMDDETLFSS